MIDLEDGSGVIQKEDGSSVLLENESTSVRPNPEDDVNAFFRLDANGNLVPSVMTGQDIEDDTNAFLKPNPNLSADYLPAAHDVGPTMNDYLSE